MMDIQTKTSRLYDIFPDLAREYAQKLHRKKEDIEFTQKFYVSDKIESVSGERAVVSYITTATIDRDNEVLRPDGMKSERYEKSGKPVFWGHQYSDPNDVVGQCQWLKPDQTGKGIIAKTVFRNNQFADDVYHLYADDLTGQGPILRGFSVGFIPLEWDSGKKAGDPSRTYTEWELLEFSCVSIPCNPDAQTILAAKKLDLCARLKTDLGLDEPIVEGDEAPAAAPVIEQTPDLVTMSDTQTSDNVAVTETVPEAVEVESKAFDLKGNPSVWDILPAIYRALDPNADTEPFDPTMPIQSVADLYPIDYPNGYAVISIWPPNAPYQYWLYKYRYADGVATLAENPTQVAPGYVRRSIDPTTSIRDLALQQNALIKRIDELCEKVEAKQAVVESVVDVPAAVEEWAQAHGGVAVAPAPAPEVKSTITITPPAPAVKSEAEAVLDFLRSKDFDERIRLMVDKAIGRVR